MAQKVADFFALVADGLISGRLDATVALHRFPYPMQIEDEQNIMWGEADLRAHLLERRSVLVQSGVVRIETKVAGIEVPREGRFRAWVRWLYFTPTQLIDEDSASIFYLQRARSGRIEAEMCHFLSLSKLRMQEKRAASV